VTAILRRIAQAALFAAFALVVGYLSVNPGYNYASAEQAAIKLSLSHAAERLEPCVQLTVEQIAAMPANERRPAKCSRERLPLTVELEIDGEILVRIEAAPSGLWSDGPASVYERFDIAPGRHRVTARLRDTAREDGWDFAHSEDVVLEPARYFTVTFKADTGGFSFR
jgi:hypothetical protein